MSTGALRPRSAFSPETMDMSARVRLEMVNCWRTDAESSGTVVAPWCSRSESCTSENTRFQS